MNTRHISLAFAAITIASLLAGCAKSPIEEVKPSEQLTDLELSYVGATETKAAIDGTTFPQEGEIGLFLFGDEEATKAYGTGYENIKYSYNSTKKKWTASPSIKVGSETGYLYGYYPYSTTATNVKAIPVASSLNSDDVMYATPVKDVTDANASQTSITMNHALARVSIKVVNNGYTGEAKLTKIKFAGAETAPTGTLNALDGSITATKSDVTLDVTDDAQTITAAGTTYECLLVPSEVETNKQTVTLTLTIDGIDKTATLSGDNGVIIAKGTKSNITITLSNSGISVKTVYITDWNVVEVGGHKVTVNRSSETGIADDVFLAVTSNGSSAIIKTYSFITGRPTQCTCTPDGKATCSSSIDKTTGIYTFTISDVQENITAEVGYLKYNATVVYDSDMGTVKVNGNVVDSDTPVQILYGEEAEFTAEANSGCGFLKWTNSNDETLSTDNPYTISQMSSDITLKAVFGYQITTEVKPAWAGTVTGAGFYPKNFTATLTATAGGSGGKFIGWTEKDSPETTISTDNPYTFTVSGPASYVAVFDVTDVLPSLFTVNSSGTKVRFSKGNLWCDTDANPTNSNFHFEEHQYDSTPQTRDGSRSTEHISHFLWCKSASESVKEEYSETGTGTNDKFFTDNDDFAVNGVSSWRTLGSGEWKYLLDERKMTYGTGTLSSNRRYAAVKVNGMAGLLIFPDDFSSWPSAAGDEPQTFNTYGSNWDDNKYTVEQFKVLQDNGCVFLPAAGNRDGGPSSPNPAKVNLVCYNGYYWSASPYDDNRVYDLFFGLSNVTPNHSYNRNAAQSVRLVTEVK